MKRKITFLLAAFMLLAFLAVPLGMRGQTTVSYGWETSDDATQWTITDAIVATSGQGNTGTYAGKINTNHTYVQFNEKVYVTSFSFAFKRTSNNSNYNVYIETSTDGSTWTAVETYAMSSFSNGSYTTKTHTFDGTTEYYVRFHCYNTTAVRYVDDVAITYQTNASTVSTPTFDPEGGVYAGTQSVTINCETEGSTIYYTTNGSTPDNTSTQYNGAITVSETTTINAIAYVGDDASNVATATYTIVNFEHAGTEADPYSVADARTAIDANVGTSDVYATGIVSAIPTAYNSTYGNVTFNMVDEEGDEVFLQAYRCGGDEAANVAVGDVVVVYGNLIKYNTTYEFAQGCQVVSLTHPVVTTPTITVTPATINAPAEGAEGTLAVTYTNITEVVAEVYFCDANGEAATYNWITANINSDNNVDYTIQANDGEARTAYLKVYALDDNAEDVYSNLVTINQEEYVAPTYAELPFSFNGGRDDIETTDGLYQEGLGTDYNASTNPNTQLKFDGTGDWLLLQFSERPGTLTFDIKGNSFNGGTFTVQTSEDGVIYTDLSTYTELTDVQNEEFTNLGENVRYIKWIYTNKSSGNVGLGNITLAEYVEPVIVATITVNPAEVNVDAEEHDGTLTLAYVNLTITDMSDFDIKYYDAEGEEAEEPGWIEVTVAEQDPQIGEGYVVSYYMIENESEARTAYFKVYAMDDETNLVYSNLVTINQEAYVAPVASITVEFDEIEVTATGEDDYAAITYENLEITQVSDFDIQFYDAEGAELTENPDWIAAEVTIQDGEEGYFVYYVIEDNEGEARTTYFKVFAMDDETNLVYSNLVTVNQEAYVVPVLDYATLPFEFNGGRADIENTDGLTQEGLDSDYGSSPKLKFNTTGDWMLLHFEGVPGELAFDIKGNGSPWAGTFTVQTSEDGETYTDFATFTELAATEHMTYNTLGENVRYIKWIYTEKVSGNVALGNITLAEYVEPVLVASITVAPAEVNVDAEEHDGTLALTYENLVIENFEEDFDIQYYDAEGAELENGPDWIEVLVAEQDPSIGEGYVVSYYMLENDGEARTAYFKVYAMDDETNLVYSNLVTINQAEYVAPFYLNVSPYVTELGNWGASIGAIDIVTNIDMNDIVLENNYFEYYELVDNEYVEATQPDWIELSFGEQEGYYYIFYTTTANYGEDRSAYFKFRLQSASTQQYYYTDMITVWHAAYNPAAELPFEFNGVRADIENTDGLSQEGLGTDYSATSNPNTRLKFDGTGDWLILYFNGIPGTLMFDIKGNSFNGGTFTVQTSEDGETYEDLAEYTNLGDAETKTFYNMDENIRYIKWIYTAKNQGNVGLGNIHLYELGGGPAPVASIMVEFDEIEVTAIGEDDYAAITYENLEITQASDFDIEFYDATGAPLTEQPAWIDAEVTTQEGEEGYFVYYVIEDNEGEARTAYFKVFALDANAELVYSNLVTINQEAYVAPAETWVLTNLADLTEGDVFVIVGTTVQNTTYALPNNGGTNNAPTVVSIEVEDDALTAEPAEELQWNLRRQGNSYTFYPNGNTENWLYCNTTASSSSNNNMRVGTGIRNQFTLNDNDYLVTNDEYTTRYLSIYGTQDWRGYTNTNNAVTISFYKKVVEPATYTLNITGYGENEGGYSLIASPVYVNPETTGMTNGTFDLYWFNQAQELEWLNYETESFNLIPGKGYLYANSTDVELTFTGVPYDGDGEIALNYTEGADWAGWNLVGNPFGVAAEISADFYTTNPNGDELIPGENYIVDPMQGVFVIAENAESTVIFQKAEDVTSNTEAVVLNVMKNRGNVIDRAIVRFGEGRQLPKFQLNPNSTKVYIPQGAEDFAVVRSTNQNEMPVNFKAKENGSYTISVSTENLNVAYLHLIDNRTGADIDLLLTPSYTFEANAGDNANRFRLVFNVNNGIDDNTVSSNASFAYFNGSEWVISNTGNATLQVVDMMGRVLSTEAINGNTTVKVNQVAGVYMLRLVNGNDVKVQKMVVK